MRQPFICFAFGWEPGFQYLVFPSTSDIRRLCIYNMHRIAINGRGGMTRFLTGSAFPRAEIQKRFVYVSKIYLLGNFGERRIRTVELLFCKQSSFTTLLECKENLMVYLILIPIHSSTYIQWSCSVCALQLNPPLPPTLARAARCSGLMLTCGSRFTSALVTFGAGRKPISTRYARYYNTVSIGPREAVLCATAFNQDLLCQSHFSSHLHRH